MLELLKMGYTVEISKQNYDSAKFKIENGVIMVASKSLSGMNRFIAVTWMDEQELTKHLEELAGEGFNFVFTPHH